MCADPRRAIQGKAKSAPPQQLQPRLHLQQTHRRLQQLLQQSLRDKGVQAENGVSSSLTSHAAGYDARRLAMLHQWWQARADYCVIANGVAQDPCQLVRVQLHSTRLTCAAPPGIPASTALMRYGVCRGHDSKRRMSPAALAAAADDPPTAAAAAAAPESHTLQPISGLASLFVAEQADAHMFICCMFAFQHRFFRGDTGIDF